MLSCWEGTSAFLPPFRTPSSLLQFAIVSFPAFPNQMRAMALSIQLQWSGGHNTPFEIPSFYISLQFSLLAFTTSPFFNIPGAFAETGLLMHDWPYFKSLKRLCIQDLKDFKSFQGLPKDDQVDETSPCKSYFYNLYQTLLWFSLSRYICFHQISLHRNRLSTHHFYTLLKKY